MRTYWVEFGHLHKFTFGPYFRVHFGIRILSDQNQDISLNGPDSDSIRAILYHFPISLLLDNRKYDFEWFVRKFMPMPGWPEDWEKCLNDWRKENE